MVRVEAHEEVVQFGVEKAPVAPFGNPEAVNVMDCSVLDVGLGE